MRTWDQFCISVYGCTFDDYWLGKDNTKAIPALAEMLGRYIEQTIKLSTEPKNKSPKSPDMAARLMKNNLTLPCGEVILSMTNVGDITIIVTDKGILRAMPTIGDNYILEAISFH